MTPNSCRLVTIVGEVNPYGTDPRYALYHEPPHSAGGRLRRLLGLRVLNYAALRKVNLCVGKFDSRVARGKASEVRDELLPVVVLLGRKVADAFKLNILAPFSLYTGQDSPTKFVLLPHPSGLCREWNDPSAVGRVRRILEVAAPDVPWGEEN